MRKWWIALWLLAAPAVWAADTPVDAWPKDTERVVVRAFYADARMLQKFAANTQPWTVERAKRYLVVDVDEAGFAQLLRDGFNVEIDPDLTRELNSARRIDPAQRAGIPGFECYRTVSETLATGAQLAADYPALASWLDVGDSWEKQNGFGGEDLMVLKLTNAAVTGDKPKLFVMSAIHAREYTTAELNTRFGEYLLNNYGTDADATWLLDYHEVHLLLQANPDGRRQAQTGQLWRKNTNQNYCSAGSNDRGADLNRNFDFGWGCCSGSSGNQCSATYRGVAPGSEPEVQAAQDYVRAIFADNRGPGATDPAPADTSGVFIDVHSFSELVLWPWGYTGIAAPNGAALQTLGRRMAYYTGYRPEQASELYITDGTTDDFAYGELGVAAYTFELGTTFFQDCGTFESSILPDNLASLIYAAKTVRTPYLTGAGPNSTGLALSSVAVAPGAVVQMTATVDDSQVDNSNGVEPTQAISGAQITIDTPPWDVAATPISMVAVDGSFNTVAEAVSAALDTSGLETGRHTVFMRGQDASGAWGPVSAQFLYIIDPVSAPRIGGRVLAADTGLPLAASISAGSFTTVTDGNGDYELLLIPGTYTVTVTPDDSAYGGQSGAEVTVAAFDAVTQNVQLYPFCDLFADDMESGSVAWTTQGGWARTNELANSPTFSYADSPGGNYSNNVNATLTSPAIDLTDIGAVEFAFASRCRTESGYDYCIVEVSPDGAVWTEVARYDGTEGGFSNRSFTLSNLAGAAAAKVRFRLSTDVSIVSDGWHVDDVAIRGSGAQCVTITDTDGDSVGDLLDNCTLLANPAQLDTNGDGFGNACDPDLNNDGVVNVVDLGMLRAAFFSTGLADSDFNGDGVTNVTDLGILKTFFFGPPGPAASGGQ